MDQMLTVETATVSNVRKGQNDVWEGHDSVWEGQDNVRKGTTLVVPCEVDVKRL